MDRVANGQTIINDVFQGAMGIKTIAIGDEPIFIRSGGFFYLELDTKGDVRNG